MTADPVATVAAWARGLDPGRRVVLRCADSEPGHAPNSSDDVVRWAGCLRALSTAELAELVAAAPRLALALDGCRCGTATSGRGRAPAVEALVPVLAQLGAAGRLHVGSGADSAERREQAGPSSGSSTGSDAHDKAATVGTLPVGRRALFAWAAPRRPQGGRGSAGVGAASGAASGPASGAASPGAASLGAGVSNAPTAPDRRAPEPASGHGEADGQVRLVQALREIHRQTGDAPDKDQPVSSTTAAGRAAHASDEARSGEVSSTGSAGPAAPRSRRITSTGCTACSTCVRSCPTGALDLRPVPPKHSEPPEPPGPAGAAHGFWRLSVDLSACIGCGRCLALCPVEALRDEGPMSWAELAAEDRTVLESVEVRPCRKCRTPFGGEGELCQVCQLRQSNPFGSWLPPGYVAPRVYAPPVSDVDDDNGDDV